MTTMERPVQPEERTQTLFLSKIEQGIRTGKEERALKALKKEDIRIKMERFITAEQLQALLVLVDGIAGQRVTEAGLKVFVHNELKAMLERKANRPKISAAALKAVAEQQAARVEADEKRKRELRAGLAGLGADVKSAESSDVAERYKGPERRRRELASGWSFETFEALVGYYKDLAGKVREARELNLSVIEAEQLLPLLDRSDKDQNMGRLLGYLNVLIDPEESSPIRRVPGLSRPVTVSGPVIIQPGTSPESRVAREAAIKAREMRGVSPLTNWGDWDPQEQPTRAINIEELTQVPAEALPYDIYKKIEDIETAKKKMMERVMTLKQVKRSSGLTDLRPQISEVDRERLQALIDRAWESADEIVNLVKGEKLDQRAEVLDRYVKGETKILPRDQKIREEAQRILKSMIIFKLRQLKMKK